MTKKTEKPSTTKEYFGDSKKRIVHKYQEKKTSEVLGDIAILGDTTAKVGCIVDEKDIVYFDSLQDAHESGYSNCPDCIVQDFMKSEASLNFKNFQAHNGVVTEVKKQPDYRNKGTPKGGFPRGGFTLKKK